MKQTVYCLETGDKFERFSVDAKEMVATGRYSYKKPETEVENNETTDTNEDPSSENGAEGNTGNVQDNTENTGSNGDEGDGDIDVIEISDEEKSTLTDEINSMNAKALSDFISENNVSVTEEFKTLSLAKKREFVLKSVLGE